MFKRLQVRLLVILALALGSGWLLYQNEQAQDSIVTLGLDLQGGTHLALEIDETGTALTDEQRADAIERALKIVRTRIDELGVAEPVVQRVGDDRIVVQLPGLKGEARAKEIIQRTAFLQFQIVRPQEELAAALPRIDRAIVAALGAEAAGGAATPSPTLGGIFEDTAAAEADTAAAARPLTAKLLPAGQGGAGEFAVALEDVPAVERYLALPEVQRLLPRGTVLRWGMEPRGDAATVPYRALYLLESRPIMTGEYLEDAQAQRDPQFGQPIVAFELSRRGGRQFARATGENIGEQMAIVLDERVFSAPQIQSEIENRGQITMSGSTVEEASDLALVLRAGALPAPIRIVEERTIGPSLGADSIEKGRFAAAVGIALVVLIMLVYYRVAGAFAVAALGLYVLFVLGGLASVGAALTLPGIAGLILSIGMAVDANVLIFERIREELEAGRAPRVAVNEGFGHALSAIVDSQITTLITAAILFQFGTGPVRGFAVTLAIGIVAAMFTAIFVTRTFFMLYLERRTAPQTLSI